MTVSIKLLWAMSLMALLLGLGGALHPIGDSFAVLRPQVLGIFAGLSGALWGLRAKVWAGLGAVTLAFLAPTMVIGFWQTEEPGPLTLYQKNLLMTNPVLAEVEADIRAMAPDIVTLQEVSSVNRSLMAALEDVLPQQQYCPYGKNGGMGVATHFRTIAPGFCALGMAALQVEGPEGPLWIVSVHLAWPWPFRQAWHLKKILPQIEGLEGPMIVAGDFNMVRWSDALQRVRTAGRVQAAGRILGSFPVLPGIYALPIDQVMSPGGGQTELRPLLGSDHLGIFARLNLSFAP